MTRMQSETFQVKINGDYACFTRPEMKVERVSYEVMTPSAARGVLEAVLWKPAIHWQVHRIDVLNPIHWTSVRRNEVSSIASTSTAAKTQKKLKTSTRPKNGCVKTFLTSGLLAR